MPDTVEEIDRQIQELIREKKRVSDEQNLVEIGFSQSTVDSLSFEGTTSNCQLPNARGKVENRDHRSRSGHPKRAGGSGSKNKTPVSLKVCTTLARMQHSRMRCWLSMFQQGGLHL